MTNTAAIHCDELPHPPAAVWRALTDPALMARWWAAGDVRPVVGHRFTLDMGPWGRQPCEVLEVAEERLLRHAFAEETLGSTLTWRLAPEGAGTRLLLTHDGLDLDTQLGRQAHEGMGRGWPGVLRAIESALDSPAGAQAGA
jgi:uncharacterized protein YndB with AHSA1/START domain